MTRRVVIMGAAGRDFHVFNCCYRDKADARVVAFTATQIPHIANRVYPPELAGSRYPGGIPIHSEEDLGRLIENESIDDVVFSYSDVSFEYVDERERFVESCGATFCVFDVERTWLDAG